MAFFAIVDQAEATRGAGRCSWTTKKSEGACLAPSNANKDKTKSEKEINFSFSLLLIGRSFDQFVPFLLSFLFSGSVFLARTGEW